MYERRQAEIEEMRARLERELAARDPDVRETADEYLRMLDDAIETIEDGPVADPRIADLDTTGAISRAEQYEEWAERERHRVRREIQDIS